MAPFSYLSTLLLSSLSTCLADIVSLGTGAAVQRLRTRNSQPTIEDIHFLPPAGSSHLTDETDTLELLDIVLVASVDGKFHALNRTTGRPIWSISSGVTTPLVKTEHAPGDDDTEQYIIEPQSGDIYVISSPNSPLQRLPFSMAQLVDMSPFSFGEEDGRTFIGRKTTGLIMLELETGKITSLMDTECPWEPPEQSPLELDLDELEENGGQVSVPTEILIGRTNYEIAILPGPRASVPKPPKQRLSFSVYGPNNQDLAVQALYRRTSDDTYIQSFTNGEIICFRAQEPGNSRHQSPIAWQQSFSSPIVAVFDVVRSPKRPDPFVLLQPRSRIQDLFPQIDLAAAALANPKIIESTYVGLLEDTGSLFAMSAERFPLVVFGDAHTSRPGIDPPPGLEWGGADAPADVDSVTRRRRIKELCASGSMRPQCLVGVRELEADSRSRLSRLLDGAPATGRGAEVGDEEALPTAVNQTPPASRDALPPAPTAGWLVGIAGESALVSTLLRLGEPSFGFTLVTTALIILASVWLLSRRRREHPRQSPIALSVKSLPEPELPPAILPVEPVPVLAPTEVSTDSQPATPVSLPPQPTESGGVALIEPAEEKMDEKDGDEPDAGGSNRKKIRRRPRRKKKAGDTANGSAEPGEEDEEPEKTPAVEVRDPLDHVETPAAPTPTLSLPTTPGPPLVPSLVVSDEVLGFGSHGTVVYRGSLQGRAVAVKRLLQDFVTLASREVNILQQSDDHPNVIRYYYQEAHGDFLYIALELCPASLADVIERPDQFRALSNAFEPKRALRQVTAGLRHLHALKIVHRDIKPPNILVSAGGGMLISDFGLCRKLEVDQTSFLPTVHGAMAVGTVGWRAPEVLRGEVTLDGSGDESSRGSVGSAGGGAGGKPTRLTKSVDIFALGCLFFYVLTNGGHPYGDRFEREVNIMRNVKTLQGLEQFGEEGSEAVDLIGSMLEPEAPDRPDTKSCLLHPFFWDPGKRLGFLQDASDRFEIMCREPRTRCSWLEAGALGAVGPDWYAKLDRAVIENLGKFRKYDGKSVQDLMRALRNKKHHYQDLPEHVKRIFGPMPEGYLAYFTRRFPRLFLHVYALVADSMLRHENIFRTYFELAE